jgi:hypothetical protein
LIAPPLRPSFTRTSPGKLAYLVFVLTLVYTVWAYNEDAPVRALVVPFLGGVVLWVSKIRRYRASKVPYPRRLTIWREFLVCVPCDLAFLTDESAGRLGLRVKGWRASVGELRNAVVRLESKGC